MVKKLGKFEDMGKFFKALETMKVGEEAISEGVKNVKIEVLSSKAIFVKGHYRKVNGKRVWVKPYYRRKVNPARR